MDSELRVEIGIRGPGECPVAAVSADTKIPVTSVSRASIPDRTGSVAEEFIIEGKATPRHEAATRIATYDAHEVYRFRRSRDQSCVCEHIEAFGYPVSEIHAADGTLYVSFHAPDLETIQEITNALQERFSGIHLRTLTQFDEDSKADLVFVDRGRLTARQREVLQTAYDMGYFDHPKGANASEVADTLEISSSTFSEHLSAAQRKVLDALLTN
jgi:predicted DNA binding protein